MTTLRMLWAYAGEWLLMGVAAALFGVVLYPLLVFALLMGAR